MYAKLVSEKSSRKESLSSLGTLDSNTVGADLRGMERKNRHAPLVESEILRKPKDIREDPKYEGQTEVFLMKVPLTSVDERREVDEQALREWIMYGIIEEDPLAQRFFDEIHKIAKIVKEVEENLLNIPKLQFMDENGQPMRDDRAREQREKLFDQYGQERISAEMRLDDTERALREHVAQRKTMKIDLERCDEDENSATAIWRFKLSGADDVELIEDLLLQKMNWAGIKLTTGDPMAQPPVLPWAGRGALPDGSDRGIEYPALQVNMLGIRVVRAPQGIGFMRSLDRSSTSLYAEEFSFYYGEYDQGVKHGYGIEITDAGVYTGTFEKGFRCGRGRLDLADGTTVLGQFGAPVVSTLPPAREFPNPYLEGEPHGAVEVFFGDGGYYRGEMVHGSIQGMGDYQSALDEVRSGSFVRGVLHGEKGFHKNVAGETYLGRFSRGVLHGPGHSQSPGGYSYEGDWELGRQHGRGVARLQGWLAYRGYHVYGVRHGKGSLEFRSKPSPADRDDGRYYEDEGEESQSQPIPESVNYPVRYSDLDSAFLGYLHGGRPANRGALLDCQSHLSRIVSRSSRQALDPLQQALEREERRHKRCQRLHAKLSFMEHFLREEVSRKKKKMFRQQRHLTKKMMYEDDVLGGLRERKLQDSKLFLRENRLNKFHTRQKPGMPKESGAMEERENAIKMGSRPHPHATQARVPRLRLLNTTLYREYTDTQSRLRPDPQATRLVDSINEEVVRLALSDMEEVRERQRFLKYDVLWQRAEEAFVQSQQDRR